MLNLHVHTSKSFQDELEQLRTAVLKMGGKVESQFRQAVSAYSEQNISLAEHVMHTELEVNREHLEIDHLCSEVIARRQPAASDLRMLLGIIRTVSDLERVGDEATKIAKLALRSNNRSHFPRVHSIYQAAELATSMLRQALDSFAREDTKESRHVMTIDVELDQQYDASIRQLITFMMEDPRTISGALDDIWVAKSIERVGDHAENIAEVAIYIVEGEDIRYKHSVAELDDTDHYD